MSMRPCVLLLAFQTLAVAHHGVGPVVISANIGIGPRPQAGCCFNDTVVDHGQVVFNLPSKCLQLVCNNGKILPHFLGDPDTNHCCEFDGLLYGEGAELSGHCVVMQCTRKGWLPRGNIDDCCKHCCIHDDSHFFTFDGHQYDWHGYSNYSMAQTDMTYDPEAGVFSDLEPVFNLLVNGDPYTVPVIGAEQVLCSSKVHSVLAWRNGQCTMLLGTSKLMVQHSRHRLDMWAHPTHADNLDGLCGPFNFYDADDFTSRQVDVHPLGYFLSTFPHSWRTQDQNDHSFRQCRDCQPPRVDRLYRADERQLAKYRSMCEKYLGSIIDQNTRAHHGTKAL
ncbi:mucin-6-like [Homarus americanus]|uniref:mucin-6-like n=1 Tax=Homarus americanus TaxID=6706 RepID=UPI001C467E4B|nr:mucin-6-like [Homarus americanus]